MRAAWYRTGVAALAAIGIAAAPTTGVAATKPAEKLPEIQYETYTLPNGLKVLTHEDHKLPLVAIDLWYHVGPLNERAGRTGFAHLFEHMMFEGSEHVGEKAHIKYVESAGATDVNGTTDFDRTNYFETLPSNQLELGLWLESDRMGFLMEGLDREKLANQRDVVRNERRQGEGEPYQAAEEEVYHQLFPKTHPYYADVIGSHADVEAARIADVRDFHQQFYIPNNASIAVAGDFDPKKLKDLLTRYFGPIPRGADVPPVQVTTPAITAQRRSTVTDTVQLPQLRIAWLTAPLYQPGDAEIATSIRALGGAKASRLDKVLIYQRGIAQSVSCENNGLAATGVAQCTVTAKPGIKLEDLEAVVWEEIAKLQKDGPTADEVDASRQGYLTGRISGLQRLGGFGGIADMLNQYNQYTGDPGYLPKDLGRIVTPESARAAAAKYLTKQSAVVVYCVPGKKVVNDPPRSPADTDANAVLKPALTPEFEASQSWRKTVPAPGPQPAVHLPVPTTFALKNGLKVYLIESHALPVFSAELVSRAGAEANPLGKPGLAGFTAGMLTEGTERYSATEQADAADRIGANLSSGSSEDSASVSTGALTYNVDAAMGLLSDAVQHPAFREADIDRVRKRRLVGIAQEADNPIAVLLRVAPRMVYGDQPYGQPPSGTTESITGITPADLRGFWSNRFSPADSALILGGDLTLAQARTLAEKSFGTWQGNPNAAVTLPPPPPLPTLHIVLVDKPGSPQTAVAAISLGVPRNTPDLPAIETLNYTLGGSFASRINFNLREVHGYTYGAGSQFSLYRGGGPFFAYGLIRTDATGPATKELLSEIRRIQTDPPTPDELKQAKTSSVQSLPGEFETNRATVGAMASLFIYDRPLDFYAKLPARYEAVTAADVAKAAKDYIHPDGSVIVAIGDKSKIEPGLKELKLPIEYRDVLGNPVK